MDVDWSAYYRAIAGREPRPLFRTALERRGGGPPGEAIDLGSGDGTETLALLDAGWRVTAVDLTAEAASIIRTRVPADQADRLVTQTCAFIEAHLPAADLVYAGFSLPFMAPPDFAVVWPRLRAALRHGGILAVDLFGPNDSWAGTRDMTFLARSDIDQLLRGLEVLSLEEEDADGMAASGPKHWHLFKIVARRPSAETVA